MSSQSMLELASDTNAMESALICIILDTGSRSQLQLLNLMPYLGTSMDNSGLLKRSIEAPTVMYTLPKNILAGREVVAKLQHLELGQGLKHEYHIQKALSGSKGIPHVWWFSTDWGTEVLVMDHSALSLQDLMSRNHSSALPSRVLQYCMPSKHSLLHQLLHKYEDQYPDGAVYPMLTYSTEGLQQGKLSGSHLDP
ncbi:hypothetical protein EDD17DRAFT_1509582 [Pisolithus thermaeus]|nr:hypothetical protein EV401DRAFT_1891770 [Pisolithus croceorrhizus]KAI6160938.1 hypothetical protein EDD17DRAFT_1509582 [Pisolithus thermaeus]